MSPHPSAVFTEEMYARLHQLWDGLKLSGSQCGTELRKEYPGYPGSLTRSAVLGVLARARTKDQYKGWFVDRTPKGGTKPKRWGDAPAREPLWHRPSSLPPSVPKPVRVRHTVVNGDELIRRTRDRTKRTTEQSFNTKRSIYSGQALPVPPKVIEGAQERMSKLGAQFTAPEGSTPKTIMELEDHDCRWPIEVGVNTFYCGCPKIDKRYCSKHARM